MGVNFPFCFFYFLTVVSVCIIVSMHHTLLSFRLVGPVVPVLNIFRYLNKADVNKGYVHFLTIPYVLAYFFFHNNDAVCVFWRGLSKNKCKFDNLLTAPHKKMFIRHKINSSH